MTTIYRIAMILFLSIPSLGWSLEQNFPQLLLRGTHNNWSATLMTLVDNNTWQTTVSFEDSPNERFKFDVHGDWFQNYGDSNGDGFAELGGADIFISEGSGPYVIRFNDSTFAYTVNKVQTPPDNSPPKADAGQDIFITVGESAQFDASGSNDIDGAIVKFEWSNGLIGRAPNLVYEEAGVFPVTLTVTDNRGASDTDEVVVTVSDDSTQQNFSQLFLRGTSNAWGSTPFTPTGDHNWELVTSFGTTPDERFKFDVNGDWSENYGDNNQDNIADINGDDILVSEGPGDYRIIINDQSLTYSVTKLGASNQAPVANAGADISANVGELVVFDASASFDPDGVIENYSWSNGLSGVNPSTTFNSEGEFTITLTVTDDLGATATDDVTVTVIEASDSFLSNFPTLFVRGTTNNWLTTEMTLVEDFIWQVETEFSNGLEERFKFDVTGDWSQNFGDLNADGIAEANGGDIFINEGEGRYQITLNDNDLRYTVIRTGDINQAPIADAGPDLLINIGDTVTLDGSGSLDPDGDIVAFQWSNGSTATSITQTFEEEGDFQITLTVSDDAGQQDTDSVRIVVADLDQVPNECVSDIQFLGDSDQDGFPDCAELPGINYRDEQYYLLGARAGVRDLFVEIDWMETDDLGVIPQKEALQKVKDAFSAQGIGLHLDTGSLYHSEDGISPRDFDLGGGSPLPFVKTIQLGESNNPEIAGLLTLKTQHMRQIRQNGPWYYLVFGSSRNLDGSSGSSGVAEISGKHCIVSLGNWGLNRNSDSNTNRLINFQAGTIMHEYGHVLGLRHGGFENTNRKPNYLSVMSYDYQLNGLPTIGNNEGDRIELRTIGACGSTLVNGPSESYENFIIDFSHGLSQPIDERGPISEQDGFGFANSSPIDWNCDGDTQDTVSSIELNDDTFFSVHEDYDDWANIEFIYFEENNEDLGLRRLFSTFAPWMSEAEHSVEESPTPEFFEKLKREMNQ